MAGVANLKINERLNIERPKIYERVTKIKNENWAGKASNMRRGKIVSGAEYRMDEQFQIL